MAATCNTFVAAAQRHQILVAGLLGGGWVFSARAEGGYIHPLENSPGPGSDPIRITDRFFGHAAARLRHPRHRAAGHARAVRRRLANIIVDDKNVVSDALGGRAYYMGRLELEFPTSSTLKSFGLRPSAFVDVGSVWGLTTPLTDDIIKFCTAAGQPTQEITPALTNTSCTQFNTGRDRLSGTPMRSPASASASSAIRQAASVGRYRRQLGFAFRAAPDRPRQGDPQGGRRRHQTLQLQRRNSILMRKILLLAAIAAATALPTAAQCPGRRGGDHPSSTPRTGH